MRSWVDAVGAGRRMWRFAVLSVLALAAVICAVVTFGIAVQALTGGMGPAVEARVLEVADGGTLGRCVHPRTYTVAWIQDGIERVESFVECASTHEYAPGVSVRLWRGVGGHLVGSSPALIGVLCGVLSWATGALAVFAGRGAVRA